ncbi:hypothetical protein OS190_03730 [Sulfitobacter sp. F26204]|uniref:hypothetical protein n=1 Tax=Sulfitobacter sp. F26204 TaxID=2996014 RepID=UPI00225DD99E|nr:hypothetical protein [Sulfitobacter sp. F26204]MCX7558663.1 hypothetical protein [Sulfitobacter sp. F26204]
MTIHFPRDAAPFIATSRDILRSYGIEITIGSNFEDYSAIIKSERKVQNLGAPFDYEKYQLKENQSFWLIGRNAEGDLIHTQAAKKVPLKGNSLATHLLTRFRDFPPPIPGVDFERSRYRATPGAHRIKGNVVYHGEVWMAPEEGRYRGSGLSTVLARTGLLEVMRRWNADYIYGFMLRQVAFKGFAERMGYMHNEPGALAWHVAGREQPLEAFLTYLSQEDAKFVLDIPVEDLVAQAA